MCGWTVEVEEVRAEEQPGVVVARYHQIEELDWIASPVLEFLYAVERPEEVPVTVTAESVWGIRERYRERYMREIVPDGTQKDKATDEWWKSACGVQPAALGI